MSIGDRIIELRKKHNMSQLDLAEAVGVTRQAVSKWENNLATPEPSKIILLSEILDTDLEYLTTGRETIHRCPPRLITVDRIVEKPVEVIVEKPVYIEKVVRQEVPVEVEKTVVRKVYRTKYVDNTFASIILAAGCFLIGLLIGLLF